MTAVSVIQSTDADEYRRRVVAVVDRAPPLSVTQQAQIALLLRDAVSHHARTSTLSTGRRAA